MQITAAVVRKCTGPFTLELVDLTDPRPDELLVEVVATGMCQTDLHARDGYYPTFATRRCSATRAPASCARSVRPSPSSSPATTW